MLPFSKPIMTRPKFAGIASLSPNDIHISNQFIAFDNYLKSTCTHMYEGQLAFIQDDEDMSMYKCKCCGIRISSEDYEEISETEFEYIMIFKHKANYINSINVVCKYSLSELKNKDLAETVISAIQYGYSMKPCNDYDNSRSNEISKILMDMRIGMVIPGKIASCDTLSQLDTMLLQYREAGGDIITKDTPTLCKF